MTKNEALKLALEALEAIDKLDLGLSEYATRELTTLDAFVKATVTAIKEALAQPAPEREPVKHLMVAYKLAQKELARLVEENFGQMPRNDKWADSVLDLRNGLESQQTESKK